ncbi:MAG TPA: hypothetical protein IAB00_01720 [Candidatus Avidehalobacter gallistercoris]|uniref:Lipoprotein n=1 Tax=Candidatus Avidehalobacter gallistercoris TaxID=2840694 RepID=A0A9D1HJ16_9FIRM|nr:hypothetical protein [Candidatus Avidehalobacter gallistercoris]
MKKFISLMAACLLILGCLAGCGTDNNANDTGTGTTGTSTGMGVDGMNTTNTGLGYYGDSYDTNGGYGDNTGMSSSGIGGSQIGHTNTGRLTSEPARNDGMDGTNGGDYQNSGVIGAGNNGTSITADM